MIPRSKAMFFLLVTLVAGVAFSACSSSPQIQTEQETSDSTEKKGDTVVSGKLTHKSGKYFIEQSGQPPQEVDTYSVDLASYTDKNVTITGQFSGDTLFAGKIKQQ